MEIFLDSILNIFISNLGFNQVNEITLITLNSAYIEELVQPLINLNILSIFAIFICTLVVTTLNTIVSVLYLIVLYVILAYFLISIGIVFLGISYIIIYIGAIAILFLFILMILDIELIREDLKENNKIIPLIFLISSLLFLLLYLILPSSNSYLEIYLSSLYFYIIYFFTFIQNFFSFFNYSVLLNDFIQDFDDFKFNNFVYHKDYINPIINNAWDMHISNNPQVNSLGFALYSNYWIWLILVCIILVLAIISVITLTMPKTKDK
jgi:NADH-ubiquinone oxidoreductase chain 6